MIPTTRRFASLALVLSLAAACGDSPTKTADSHESVMREGMDLMDELIPILEGVEDQASAETASDQLTVLAGKMRDLGRRAQALDEPTEEQQVALRQMAETRQQKRVAPLDRALSNPNLQKFPEELMDGWIEFTRAALALKLKLAQKLP